MLKSIERRNYADNAYGRRTDSGLEKSTMAGGYSANDDIRQSLGSWSLEGSRGCSSGAMSDYELCAANGEAAPKAASEPKRSCQMGALIGI